MLRKIAAISILVLVTSNTGLKIFAGGRTKDNVPIMVDDFNQKTHINLLGGGSGAWIMDPTDPGLKCEMEFDEKERVGEKGASLKITYDIRDSHKYAVPKEHDTTPDTQEFGALSGCGYFTKLMGIDITGYDSLDFWLKGSPKDGFTSSIVIELKTKDNVASYKVEGIQGYWQEFSVPLWKMRGITDWSEMVDFVIVLNDDITKKIGSFWIDDVTFK